MAKYAKHGGIVLTAAGVGVGCYNIAQAQNQQVKNEIFVETAASATAGTIASIALGVMLVGTPVGWVTAIVLGAGTTLTAYGTGKFARNLYDQHFREYDFVNMTRVSEICG